MHLIPLFPEIHSHTFCKDQSHFHVSHVADLLYIFNILIVPAAFILTPIFSEAAEKNIYSKSIGVSSKKLIVNKYGSKFLPS